MEAKRNNFPLVWIAALSLPPLMQGCFIPVPHQRLHQAGVQGWLVGENNIPVANASLKTHKRETTTDAAGFFKMEPVYGWHGAYLWTPPLSHSLFPHHCVSGSDALVSVDAEGYPAQTIFMTGHTNQTYRLSREINAPMPGREIF